jgi:hypothetical protein
MLGSLIVGGFVEVSGPTPKSELVRLTVGLYNVNEQDLQQLLVLRTGTSGPEASLA